VDKIARIWIYTKIKQYLIGVSDKYLHMIISRIRKINKLFEYKYDSVSLKKIKGISRHIIQLVTYNTDKISKLINSQIDYIIE